MEHKHDSQKLEAAASRKVHHGNGPDHPTRVMRVLVSLCNWTLLRGQMSRIVTFITPRM